MHGIALGTRVWVSTVAPKLGHVVRDTRYAGTVLRQSPYETTWYRVKLDNGTVLTVSDSMIQTMEKKED